MMDDSRAGVTIRRYSLTDDLKGSSRIMTGGKDDPSKSREK